MFDYYDTLITPEEVADMLNCGMNTTYKLLKTGRSKQCELEEYGKFQRERYKNILCRKLI